MFFRIVKFGFGLYFLLDLVKNIFDKVYRVYEEMVRKG